MEFDPTKYYPDIEWVDRFTGEVMKRQLLPIGAANPHMTKWTFVFNDILGVKLEFKLGSDLNKANSNE